MVKTNRDIVRKVLQMPLVYGFKRYDYVLAEEELIQRFINRGYNPKSLEEYISKIQSGDATGFAKYAIFEITFNSQKFPGDDSLEYEFPELKVIEKRSTTITTALQRHLIRFSSLSDLTHLGIIGSFIQEFNNQLPGYLDIINIKLHQTDHGEEPYLVFTRDLGVTCVGGGRLTVNPNRKTINFYGKSTNLRNNLDAIPEKEWAERNSKYGFNSFAKELMDKYIKEKGLGYTTKVLKR